MEEEANKFLRSHRVTTVDRQFCPDNGGYWTLLVSYQDSAGVDLQGGNRHGKVDYCESLSPEEFEKIDQKEAQLRANSMLAFVTKARVGPFLRQCAR